MLTDMEASGESFASKVQEERSEEGEEGHTAFP